jgi:hypothetical protein
VSVSINPELIRLGYKEFKKWAAANFPELSADELWKSIGGELPGKTKGEAE